MNENTLENSNLSVIDVKPPPPLFKSINPVHYQMHLHQDSRFISSYQRAFLLDQAQKFKLSDPALDIKCFEEQTKTVILDMINCPMPLCTEGCHALVRAISHANDGEFVVADVVDTVSKQIEKYRMHADFWNCPHSAFILSVARLFQSQIQLFSYLSAQLGLTFQEIKRY